jgi:hypothetical protein
MVESLAELATSRFSPWRVNYEWSNDAKSLRELAIKSPWVINDEFIWNFFRSLRILDQGVSFTLTLISFQIGTVRENWLKLRFQKEQIGDQFIY